MIKRSVLEGLVALTLWTFSVGCGSSPPGAASNPANVPQIEDLVTGTGAEAVPNKKLSVHYVARLSDGEKLDSSRDRGAPLEFALGSGAVIPSWELAVRGMRVGGKRRVTVPPGARQIGGLDGLVSANATLVFELELLAVD
jgi:FKBP-type peptidyl-prolyl cis-trans isomerase